MEKLGNYDILRTLGEGAYGVVQMARFRPSGLLVALKQPKLSDEKVMNELVVIVRREIMLLEHLRHRNIVRFYNCILNFDRVYLVFEYADSSLLKYIKDSSLAGRRGIGSRQTIVFSQQLLKALEFLHMHNITHHDLKPDNCLLNHDGRLLVCDFGMSNTGGIAVNSSVRDVGTPIYRAPEMLMGTLTQQATNRVDIWATGCCVFERIALAGSVPSQKG
ncbi:kinase-like protein [Meredithblackwellia eburnea MCA 4105]